MWNFGRNVISSADSEKRPSACRVAFCRRSAQKRPMNNVWQKHLTGWGKRHPTDTNPLKPPRPVQTSSPLGSSSAKAAGKIPLSVTAHSPVVYDAQTGRRHLPTPPGSTGARTMTPSRGESGLTAQTGMAMSVVGDISTAGAITPHQKQRQQLQVLYGNSQNGAQ